MFCLLLTPPRKPSSSSSSTSLADVCHQPCRSLAQPSLRTQRSRQVWAAAQRALADKGDSFVLCQVREWKSKLRHESRTLDRQITGTCALTCDPPGQTDWMKWMAVIFSILLNAFFSAHFPFFFPCPRRHSHRARGAESDA